MDFAAFERENMAAEYTSTIEITLDALLCQYRLTCSNPPDYRKAGHSVRTV